MHTMYALPLAHLVVRHGHMLVIHPVLHPPTHLIVRHGHMLVIHPVAHPIKAAGCMQSQCMLGCDLMGTHDPTPPLEQTGITTRWHNVHTLICASVISSRQLVQSMPSEAMSPQPRVQAYISSS